MIAFLLSMTVMAQQPIIGFGTNEVRYVGENVIVPIIIANMPPINSIGLGIEFNQNSLTYVGGTSTAVTPWLVFHVEPSVPNRIMIGGYIVGESVTIPDGVLGYITFTYKKFESPLNFIPHLCEFSVKSETGGAPILVSNVTYTNGWVIPVVDLAGKTWMARNAVFGTKITTGQQTNNGITEYFVFNDTLFGGYYKWDESMNYTTEVGAQGICPSGWHVPTISEWASLVRANLGDSIYNPTTKKMEKQTFNYFPLTTYNTAAKKLKATRQPTNIKIKTTADLKKLTWSGSYPGTGESGFNAVGGGWWRNGQFGDQSTSGLYWTSEQVEYKTFDPTRFSNIPGSDPVVFQFLSVDQTVRIITLKRSTDHISLRCVKN